MPCTVKTALDVSTAMRLYDVGRLPVCVSTTKQWHIDAAGPSASTSGGQEVGDRDGMQRGGYQDEAIPGRFMERHAPVCVQHRPKRVK